MDVLKESVKISPESKVVMVSGYAHYELEARQLGAHDYISKPWLAEQLFKIVI